MTDMQNETDNLDQPLPNWLIPFVLIYVVVVLSLVVFLPAGDWAWLV